MWINLSVEKRSFHHEANYFAHKELNNCSLGGNFPVLQHAEIFQFDQFSLQINFKEHIVVIMEFPDWVQVYKNIL